MTTTPASTTSAPEGSRRVRVTRPRVRITDAVARVVVTVGGLGVIVAVLGILASLLSVVFPLAVPGHAEMRGRFAIPATLASTAGDMLIDDNAGVALLVDFAGAVHAVSLVDGSVVSGVAAVTLPNGTTVSARAPVTPSGAVALGLSDGSIVVLRLGFRADTVEPINETEQERAIAIGERLPIASGGYAERSALGRIRRTVPAVTIAPPVRLEQGSGPIIAIDLRSTGASEWILALRQDATCVLGRVTTVRPLGGGAPRVRLTSEVVKIERGPDGVGPLPQWLLLSGDGEQIFGVHESGRVDRYARPGTGAFVLADRTEAFPPGRKVTSAEMLLGGRTLVLGDSAGAVVGAFAAQAFSVSTPDGRRLVVAHRYEPDGATGAVTKLLPAQRDRSIASLHASGELIVRNMTSGRLVCKIPSVIEPLPVVTGSDKDHSTGLVAASPRGDAMAVLSPSGQLATFGVQRGHPEVSLRSLFGKVWYEGDAAPSFTTAASQGEDSAEPKYSLVPLIFGTIKATIYAMLFATPIAILAAIYTSEILHPRVRSSIKPVIEMMASLPSVVLGFVAALVVAPLLRDTLPFVLLAFVTVPVGALLAAYVWQMLPIRLTARLRTLAHLGLVSGVVVGALGITSLAAPLVERALFTPSRDDQLVLAGSVDVVPREQWPEALRDRMAVTADDSALLRQSGLAAQAGRVVRPVGSVDDPAISEVIARDALDRPSIRRWLDGSIAAVWPGWFVLLAPPMIVLSVLLRSRLIDPMIGTLPIAGYGTSAAVIELIKFCVTLVAAAAAAFVLASLIAELGFDARDSILGSYQQRNSLVVAIVMGFAVIPIIYTISEDALSAVPASLRSASLGCGATRWQTATRVVLPVAMSGVFSAVMIGLGRAAGETMIVLMATGNTPIMEWNIFNGFRTLAANIAVSMPEAPEGSTQLRVLFLGGLCLFALTFFINTLAELVRIRVRRRSANL